MSAFVDEIERTDRILKAENPGRDLDELVVLLGNAAVQQYFFDRVDSAAWLDPLSSRGFFELPPEPVRNEKGVAIPRWPASGYLERMASKSPETVMKIIERIPDTSNTRVHEDYADAALAVGMPIELTARWADKEAIWVSRQDHLFFGLPRKLGQLVARLAKGGKAEAALNLAKVLLAVLRGPAKESIDIGGKIWTPPSEPRARFDLWEYEQVLKTNTPDLIEATGLGSLALLCDLVSNAIQVSQSEDSAQPHDLSYVWRSAIEDHGQNVNLGLKPILVTAVRDAAVTLARQGPSRLSEVVDVLEQRGRSWLIFRRIALHVLRIVQESPLNLICERLVDRRLFDEVGVRHEYVLLLKERFGQLANHDQETILGWISQGPDVPDLKARLAKFAGSPVTDDDVENYKKNWRRDRLEPIAPYLEGDWKARYEALVKRTAIPEHPEFPVYMTGGFLGPTSPKTVDDLKDMPPAELAAYLNSWQPTSSDPIHGATPAGLGSQVTSLVSANPQKYAAEADLFRLDEPTYVRSVLWGFRNARAEGQIFAWEKVLDLCIWACKQPREISDRKEGPLGHFDRDPNWVEARKAVLRIVSESLEKEGGVIPFSLRYKVWEALEPLTRDPHPTRQDEEQVLFGGLREKYAATGLKVRNVDVMTYSINTVRGEAMHAVVSYALWVRRNIENQPDSTVAIGRGFDSMPEARNLLDERLDPEEEPSLAVRAVYGRAFPWFYQIDPSWATEAARRIFPSAPKLADYWQAAWEAYLASWPAYDNIADALHDQYRAAVERIGGLSEKVERFVNLNERLAGHLMTLHWRGRVEYNSDLLTAFYDKANAKLRGQAIHFVGWSLCQEKNQVPRDILDRMESFWRARLQTAESGAPEEFSEEMAEFGWWFVSRKFDDHWAMDQLVSATRISKSSQPDHLVVGRLAELCGTMPSQAIECLSLIIDGDKQGWGILGWQDEAKKIIRSALNSSDSAAQESAFSLANRLGSLGHFSFLELLKPSSG